jgi:hypothetical protein
VSFDVKSVITIELPRWVESRIDFATRRATDEARTALFMELLRQQAIAHTGGHFAGAVFDGDRLVSVGAGRKNIFFY